MITLSKNGDAIRFTFANSQHYLTGNGTIDVPVNSLSLVFDSSDFATFKKAASNDIFVSAPLAEFGMSKADLISFYTSNMVSTGGGGGGTGSGITSGEVQTMIDESISGKANTDYVNTALADKADVADLEDVEQAVAQSINVLAQSVSGKADESYVETALADKADVADLEDVEQAVAQSINVINQSLSGKQDTLIAGSGITISGNVISANGGGGGGITIDPTLDSGSTNAVANSAITDGFNTYTCRKNSENGEVRYFYFTTPSKPYGNVSLSNFSINGRCPLTKTNGTNDYIDKFSLVETSAITTSMTSGSTDSQVPSAKAVYDTLGGLKLVKLTQLEYDALVTKDPDTLYIITNVVNNS